MTRRAGLLPGRGTALLPVLDVFLQQPCLGAFIYKGFNLSKTCLSRLGTPYYACLIMAMQVIQNIHIMRYSFVSATTRPLRLLQTSRGSSLALVLLQTSVVEAHKRFEAGTGILTTSTIMGCSRHKLFCIDEFTAVRCEAGACDVQVIRDQERAPESVDLRDEAYIKRAAERLPDIGRKACPFVVAQKDLYCQAAWSFHRLPCMSRLPLHSCTNSERSWGVLIHRCGSPGGWYTVVLPAQMSLYM